MSGVEDAEDGRRNYAAPYTSSHPVPSVQKYKEVKERREAELRGSHEGGAKKADFNSTTLHPDGDAGEASSPYESSNKNVSHGQTPGGEVEETQESKQYKSNEAPKSTGKDETEETTTKDTSQMVSGAQDPKQKRKQMKKRGENGIESEREVTDPVTHLPVAVRDFTSKDLKNTPQNESEGDIPPRATPEDHEQDQIKGQEAHSSLQALFPPPNFDAVRAKLFSICNTAVSIGSGIVSVLLLMLTMFGAGLGFQESSHQTLYSIAFLIASFVAILGTIWGTRTWALNRMNDAWENEVWESERQSGKKAIKSDVAESTHWLNALLASVWPLVNPDLFTSVADTLEDVMQASLPKVVRMVSVEDIGQGSESIRILGVRWLPTGASAKSVSKDGTLKRRSSSDGPSDRTDPDQGNMKDNSEDDKGSQGQPAEEQDGEDLQDDQNIGEGMEAEEGDFVNVEVAFAYRARGYGKDMQSRAKNAHLYLAFYLPGNIKFPVWVELHGIVGIIRLRLQLTPDPPFFSLCTLTFLGQPKIDLSCVPLTQKGLNIMDLPLISNFVQSSMDAAVAEYVAPKSLTLDLKDMIVGADFKTDTTAKGVLVVTIKRGYDFKEGDNGFGPLKKGSSDPYVTVGWAKFGKPVWSTRILNTEMEPYWEETAFVLVTPEELNVRERLRVQLWDSDRTSADDDLGRIEVELMELMTSTNSNGKIWDRVDGFKSLKKGEGMPGHLEWSVGYFSKTRILDSQLARQEDSPDINNVEDLKAKVDEESENKLREAKHDESAEVEQQKAQDFKEKQDQLLAGSPPSGEFPIGILSIQIHQITGLELEKINKNQANKKEGESYEEETGEDLPSSYCTIILNHQKIFRTRTKPKNSKPFFNAGCERLIRDWRTAEVHISIRDSRVHEDDPLLGVVYLPLDKVLAKRSQVNGFFPLAGGLGYGRARISLVFRSVQYQAPPRMLGWDFGTLEVDPHVCEGDSLPEPLKGTRLKVRTTLAKGKLKPDGQAGQWKSKSGRSIKLAVQKRYSTPLVIEFRNSSTFRDNTVAFSTLWLQDIPDEEEQELDLAVWEGDLERATQCCLPSCGTRVGSIKMKLKFWRGLSGYHSALGSKDRNLGDVMEVLDTVEDDEDTFDPGDFRDGSSDDSSSDSDSGGSDDGQSSKSPVKHDGKNNGAATPGDTAGKLEAPSTRSSSSASNASSEDLAADGKRNMTDQIKDYKKHSKQLHRRHRGLMQWKGPRTVKWVKGKIGDGQASLTGLFKHRERDSGIETEV